MKRTYDLNDQEPDQKQFDLPSEKEHLFQVIDVIDNTSELGSKLKLDDNTVSIKCEVVGGDESGRTLLQRLSLDDKSKAFFLTRLFLKAIGHDYKGQITIDTDMWQASQFFATVVHNKGYANIKEYNFDKRIDNTKKKEDEWGL